MLQCQWRPGRTIIITIRSFPAFDRVLRVLCCCIPVRGCAINSVSQARKGEIEVTTKCRFLKLQQRIFLQIISLLFQSRTAPDYIISTKWLVEDISNNVAHYPPTKLRNTCSDLTADEVKTDQYHKNTEQPTTKTIYSKTSIYCTVWGRKQHHF